MLLSVIENIWDFILKQTANGLTVDLIFYVGIGFTALMVLFFTIKSFYAYEGRLERSLEKLNRWLFVHQQIDETNLVEFNNLIKKAPRLLRYHWQQYMLYREKDPSFYLSAYNCIEKPLHTSSYTANIKNFMNICVGTMIVAFVLSLISYGNSAFTIAAISMPLITPTIIYIVGIICLFLLRVFQNFGLSSLYQNFHLFNRYIDKASASIPKYVDFEILFTHKEIKGGIPVLNEYLEKRARQEAEELEKARENAVEHEEYNFEDSGIDGSLILDRALKESETFLNAQQRISSEIRQFEGEIESLKKNYENVSKDYQRKLQASKENVERLRAQQEESTNRIEVNYIRKQQQDEIKKQEQLEKDQDDSTLRYNQEVSALNEQIAQKKADLNEKKMYIQNAMSAEYKTFSTKLYKGILEDVNEKHKAEINEISDQKIDLLRELEQVKGINAIKDSVIEDLKEMIRNSNINNNYNTTNAYVQEPVVEPITQTIAEEVENPVEEQPVIEEEIKEEPVAEQSQEEQQTEQLQAEESQEEQNESEETTDDAEGYYDDKGYYWYANGTYYDDLGYYHDLNGGVYNQQGEYMTEEEYEQVKQGLESGADNNSAEEQSSETEELQTEELPTEETIIKETESPVVEQAELKEQEDNNSENVNVVDDSVQTESSKPAGKRGRPRKETTEIEEKKPAGKRGRPRKEETTEIVETKPAGKRGRPRKEETTEIVETKPAGKRGRPRKEETIEVVETKPAGKRGRPRKEETTEIVETKPAGKRGRPRKETTEVVEKKTSGKRGRPRKETTEVVEKKTTGKRGRPRKNTDELQKINSQILEESNKLIMQQNELNKQLGETLNQIKAVQENDEDDGDNN